MKSDFPDMLKSLWSLIKPKNAIEGFRATGIIPRNNAAISDAQLKVAIPWDHNCLQAFTYELEELDFPKTSGPSSFVYSQIMSLAKRQLEAASGEQPRKRPSSQFAAVLTDESTNSVCKACYEEEPPIDGDKLWIQCSYSPCQQWFHTYCMEDVRNLRAEEV
jgi:hypothetical protein